MPGYALDEPHPQCSGLAARHPAGAGSRLIDLLKNAARIFQEQLSRRAYLHPAWKSVK